MKREIFRLDRRALLRHAAALASVSVAGAALSACDRPLIERPKFTGYPFTLGVASGDPGTDGFVMWTRLAPNPFERTIGEESKAAEHVRTELLQKKKLPGFGHRVYRTIDPRANHLRTLSEQLGKAMGQEKWSQMSVVIEKTCKELKNLNPNVDFYAASTYYLLGFEMDLFTPIFACSRAPGWIAHVIEQHTDNRLIRPLEEYIGPPERPYVSLEKRG